MRDKAPTTPAPQQAPRLTDWLPTTRKEMDLRGWDVADVILFSADAYVDHPSFGAAVIGRLIEAEGFRVCIVPQPDWHGDFRDFKKLGRPRLFFSIAPGAMDSMVNKYTAARRLRSEDAYSPDGRHDMRPEYPTVVYTQILKQLYPDVPVVLGGIEASLRRLTHYDYWQERLRKCILCDSGADMLVYGMGELPTAEICHLIDDKLLHNREEAFADAADFRQLVRRYPVRQTVTLEAETDIPGGIREDDIVLHSHEECLADKKKYAANFRHIEEESNRLQPQRLLQQVDGRYAVVNVPFPPMTTAQIDRSFDFPYTRLPHPKYRGKRIPAYEMIKFSVNVHRGCFGGCAFCTISAHQGKFIMSRSKESILREVRKIVEMPDFRGYLSDLGGPSANMYAMRGTDQSLCARCRRPSCIAPAVCPNLNADHRPLLDIYRAVDAIPGIKKSFIGSGVRYDLLLHPYKDERLRQAAQAYTRELILHHVSGRLKVAPEHTSDAVLRLMRKPSFKLFHEFKAIFDRINREAGLRQQLIPYFISSHPGCTEEAMAELAAETKDMDFQLEQVQDFTPTPMTVSTEAWYSGYHPYTLEPVFSAKSPEEKQRQRLFFFWYKPEERQKIQSELRRLNRPDLLRRLFGNNPAAPRPDKFRGERPRGEKPKAAKPHAAQYRPGRKGRK
ncbi:MAG: YgiQ family radical SAM protein [Bacteroidales bacterium]|nr:YgiQ family radical SAM protein [Bacteroidales bacterium]